MARRGSAIRRKREFYEGKYCIWCHCPDHLELHHVDSSKKRSNIKWDKSAVWLREELAKCVVLCHDCHVAYHSEVSSMGRIWHGTNTSYVRGCRCKRCNMARIDYCIDKNSCLVPE